VKLIPRKVMPPATPVEGPQQQPTGPTLPFPTPVGKQPSGKGGDQAAWWVVPKPETTTSLRPASLPSTPPAPHLEAGLDRPQPLR
jgi:hypothetical protein